MNIDYSNLTCSTQVPDNSSYLANTHYTAPKASLDGSTMALMMVLSTFQYGSLSSDPSAANAFSQAGKAAYIQSGGQAVQDRLGKMAETNATGFVHSMGLTDVEMGAVYEAYRVNKTHQIKFNGPRIGRIKSDLTLDMQTANIGLKYEF